MQREDPRRAAPPSSDEEDVERAAGLAVTPSFSSASSSRSIPAPKPIPGVGGPPICLDEPVVAAAAADRRVGVLVGPDELEGRCACSSRAPARASARACTARRRRRGSRARAAKCSRQASQSDSPIFGASASAARTRRVLHVEDLQRARRALLARVVVEHVGVRVEPRVQPLDVRRAAVRVADRVQLQLPLRDAEPAEQLVVELDHLGVDAGSAEPIASTESCQCSR